MRKAVGVAAVFILLLLMGCEAAVVEAETAAPSPAATPAPSRTPIPVPWPTNYTPPPPYVPPPSPAPYVSDWVPSPIHPELLPLVVYGFHYKERESPKPTPNNLEEYSGNVPREIPLIPNDQPEFGREDLIAGDLRADMTQEEVLAILGLPAEAYVYKDEMYGPEQLDLFYENGDNVRFWRSDDDVFMLDFVRVVSDLEGPRGLRVGDRIEDVIDAFRVDAEFTNGPETQYGPLLYASQLYNPDDDSLWSDDVIPPSGGINFGERFDEPAEHLGAVYVNYVYTDNPYTYADLVISDHYVYLNYPFALFECRDGRVVCYRWGY